MSAALKRGTSLHKVSRFSRGLRAKKRSDRWLANGTIAEGPKGVESRKQIHSLPF